MKSECTKYALMKEGRDYFSKDNNVVDIYQFQLQRRLERLRRAVREAEQFEVSSYFLKSNNN
jgi:hypothetical protein